MQATDILGVVRHDRDPSDTPFTMNFSDLWPFKEEGHHYDKPGYELVNSELFTLPASFLLSAFYCLKIGRVAIFTK